MRKFLRRGLNKNNRAQAMAELTIAGAILIMLLGYLLQQGYIYNMRQALEMYTFRKALQISRDQEKEITLSVMRDVVVPSFFTGLGRQRLMATSSVEYNPYILYNPTKDKKGDIGSRQLIQINEWMIQRGYFIEIPPTLITVDRPDEEPVTRWESSAIAELDSQENKVKQVTYKYITMGSEDEKGKTIEKQQEATEDVHTIITFDQPDKIQEDKLKDEPEKTTVTVGEVPKDMDFVLREKITRSKTVVTPHK